MQAVTSPHNNNHITADKSAAAPVSKPLFRPHRPIHAHWHPRNINVGGADHTLYDVPAKGTAKADVFLMSGCGSNAVYFSRQINRDFRGNGIRTLATQQAHKAYYTDNVARNLEYVEWLLLNEKSPLHMRDKDKPLFMLTNSSTAMLIEHVCLDADKAAAINQNVAHFFDTAPFFDTARTSIIHEFQEAGRFEMLRSQTLSAIYGAHAKRNADTVIGDHWLDRIVMHALRSKKTMKCMQAEIATATHGEGLAYREMGRHVVRELERLKREEPHHPTFNKSSTLYLGRNDPAACNRTARYVADLKGGCTTIFEAEAEHNPFKQSLPVRRNVIDTMQRIILPDQHSPA